MLCEMMVQDDFSRILKKTEQFKIERKICREISTGVHVKRWVTI